MILHHTIAFFSCRSRYNVNNIVSGLVDGAEITSREIPNNGSDVVSAETFKKLLKQGGSFKINGILVSVTPEEKIFNSRGETDGGAQKVDPFARF